MTTMTLNEFLNKDIDSFAKQIKKNKIIERMSVVLLGSLMYSQKCLAAGKGIDVLGLTLLNLIRAYAYHILIIMCIVEIVRSAISGDSKKILSIMMKYLLVFAAMYLIPNLFDTIKASF